MSRIKRWVRNWLNEGFLENTPISAVREVNEPNYEKCLNLKLWFANGGKVVQVNRYDQRKDHHITGLYVITSDKNFGEEIDKIIFSEGLRS